ncbi:MAG: DUF6249 domain-containing protein [Cyclobacteriaceae bacterium]
MNEDAIIIPALGIMLPIIIALGAFVMVVYIRKFENIERMAIIEKGLSPDLFKKERSTSGVLQASLLLVGAGLGLLIGYWLDRTFDMEEVAYFSMIFIFGGLGLGLAYLIEEKKRK